MDKPIFIKNWRVFDWTPDDVVWLEEQNISHRVATTNIPYAIGNRTMYMRGDVGATVITRSEQIGRAHV